MAKALIIVDMQNDFCEGGALAVPGGRDLARRIAACLKDKSFNDYDHLIFTQDWHIDPGDHFSDNPDYKTTWPEHCVANTPGAAICEELEEASLGWWRITKGMYDAGYSGFSNNKLREIIETIGIEEVDVCGIAREYCVKQTAQDALYLGCKTRILHALCVGVHDAV